MSHAVLTPPQSAAPPTDAFYQAPSLSLAPVTVLHPITLFALLPPTALPAPHIPPHLPTASWAPLRRFNRDLQPSLSAPWQIIFPLDPALRASASPVVSSIPSFKAPPCRSSRKHLDDPLPRRTPRMDYRTLCSVHIDVKRNPSPSTPGPTGALRSRATFPRSESRRFCHATCKLPNRSTSYPCPVCHRGPHHVPDSSRFRFASAPRLPPAHARARDVRPHPFLHFARPSALPADHTRPQSPCRLTTSFRDRAAYIPPRTEPCICQITMAWDCRSSSTPISPLSTSDPAEPGRSTQAAPIGKSRPRR
jgi:hypothetical protein